MRQRRKLVGRLVEMPPPPPVSRTPEPDSEDDGIPATGQPPFDPWQLSSREGSAIPETPRKPLKKRKLSQDDLSLPAQDPEIIKTGPNEVSFVDNQITKLSARSTNDSHASVVSLTRSSYLIGDLGTCAAHIEGKLQVKREQHRQALLEVEKIAEEIQLLEGYKRTMEDATEVARILTTEPTGGWAL